MSHDDNKRARRAGGLAVAGALIFNPEFLLMGLTDTALGL